MGAGAERSFCDTSCRLRLKIRAATPRLQMPKPSHGTERVGEVGEGELSESMSPKIMGMLQVNGRASAAVTRQIVTLTRFKSHPVHHMGTGP